MKINEIAFSCYPVTDMERARTFYEDLLGLKPTMDEKMEGLHWVEYDIGSGTLAIGIAPDMLPSKDGCSVALEVEDFELAVKELEAANVEFNFGRSKLQSATWPSCETPMATPSASTKEKQDTHKN